MDACAVLREPGWGFAFVDPPYSDSADRYPIPFGYSDHFRLRSALYRTGRQWFLTYSKAPLIEHLYRGYESGVDMNVLEVPIKKTRTELWIQPNLVPGLTEGNLLPDRTR